MRALLFTMFAGLMISFGASAENASITAVSQLDQNDPLTWLVKSVCVDSLNQVLRRDPYGGCPFGASIRKIQIGDPLPYHNIEQNGYQQRDAFPVADVSGTKTWIVNTFDYAPFNFFNLYATANAGSDGYDVITVQDGWASVANTSDGGGYGQAFYGSNCRLGDGWILFPANGFLSASDGRHCRRILGTVRPILSGRLSLEILDEHTNLLEETVGIQIWRGKR